MTKHAVILNPAAGHGAGRRNRQKIERLLQRDGVVYEVFETEFPDHAIDLARRASDAFDVIVAVGGDGTVHEVARGALEANTRRPLAVIPNGSGNDFVKMLGIPTGAEAAVKTLSTGLITHVDYGIVSWEGREETAWRHFINAVGFGFDAAVAREVAKLKFLPGILSYLTAALRTLRKWQSPRISVRLQQADGSWLDWYDGPCFLVTTANGRCSGGGFYLTPDASVKDGMLNACLVTDLPMRRVLRLMPKVMQARHSGEPEVRMAQLRKAHMRSERDLSLHADGEICSEATSSVSVEIVAAGLPVIVSSPEKIT